MSNRSTILTVTGTSSIQEIKITRNIIGGVNLMICNASVYIKAGELDGIDVIPKVINLQIGNTIDSFYVVDSTEGQNTLELINQYNPVTIGTDIVNISEYKPEVAYYVSGSIDKTMIVRVLDESYNPMDGAVVGDLTRPTLLSYTFQCQVI